ncbi:SDR family NAD(P)-dependent oxidoreductase [Streptomyces sp. NPDC057580]|uniref:SDR family NAD(P)-dependent oxidoreductase n=1 Tax=Streptomyces sp. NPDC057580 TaxID=3346173 RepID=UPI0036D05093
MTTTEAVDLGFAATDTVIVTGAGSGIGRSVARLGLGLGLRVSAWDLHAEGLASLAGEVDAGGRLHTHVGDIADEATMAAGFAAVREEFGNPAFLVNNAGPASSVPIGFDDAMRISVGGARTMTEAWSAAELAPHAAMVTTASVAGNRIGTESDWYSAAKAALTGYVRHLAAHRANAFRSNAVAPGMTDTPRLAGFAETETGRRILGRIPLGRMGTPDELAWPILFLLSPLAAYVNGAVLVVDGGWTVTQ